MLALYSVKHMCPRKCIVLTGIFLYISVLCAIHNTRRSSRKYNMNGYTSLVKDKNTYIYNSFEMNKLNQKENMNEKEMYAESLKITVLLNISRLHILVDEQQVYTVSGDDFNGVHVVTISGSSGRIMSTSQFKTHAPAETDPLIHTLTTLTQAEIMIISISPGASKYLSSAERELRRRGSKLLIKLALGEAATAIIVNNRVTAEGLLTLAAPVDMTKRQTYYNVHKVVANLVILDLEINIAKLNRYECDWHRSQEMALQEHFCKNYDGYPELCRCHEPISPSKLWSMAEHLNINETIPCLIVTSGQRPQLLYRMILQITKSRGGNQTPLFVHMNGRNQASEALMQLLNITYVYDPDVKGKRTVTQLLARIMLRALQGVFIYFPLSSKIIVLEEDLIVSPDLLSYFHQTAWLLDIDPTIWAVSAHRSHSFPGQGLDPTVLHRGSTTATWGWMSTRSVIKTWPPRDWEGDWDYYKLNEARNRGHHVIFPELSRTLHGGFGGSHAYGIIQAWTATRQVANLDPYVRLQNITGVILDQYSSNLHSEVATATPLPLTNGTPCHPQFPSHHHQNKYYSIFITDIQDFFLIAACLNYFTGDNIREEFENVLKLKERTNNLYIILCPVSPYCKHRPADYQLTHLRNSDLEEATALDIFRRSQDVRSLFRVRLKQASNNQEMQLENYVTGYTLLGYDRITTYFGNGVIIPLITPRLSNQQDSGYKDYTYPLHLKKYMIDNSLSNNSRDDQLTMPSIQGKDNISGATRYYPVWDAPATGTDLVGADALLKISHLPAKLRNAGRRSGESPEKPSINEFTLDNVYQILWIS